MFKENFPFRIKTVRYVVLMVMLLLLSNKLEAANYYWRIAPADNIYTNVANWETSPGGGVSPSTAPTVNDDVFFPAALNVARSINLNGGFCQNFNFNAVANFTFSGSFTINGSLTANGNAYFNIAGASAYNSTTGNTLTFSGPGTHTIDMGTDAQRFSGGGAIFFTSNTTTGTYSLENHHWLTDNTLRFNTQHFMSNGYRMDVRFMIVEGTTARTVNFTNSVINVNGTISTYSDNLFSFDLVSTGATYTMTNTRVVANSSGIFQSRVNVTASIGSLTLNNGGTSTLYTFGGMNLSMDSLIINNSTVYLGRATFGNPGSTLPQAINASVIRFMKPAVIENYANTTLGGTHTIIEAPLCNGQSLMQSISGNTLKFNTTTALTTNGLAYRAIVFGGSGVTASSSFNLGMNSGAVTWSAAAAATTFYWVGGSGNWSDPTKWSIAGSGGTPQLATGCTPTYADDVVFDANSFTANQIVSIGTEGGYCRNITFSDPANEGVLQNNMLNINGNADFTGARGISSNMRLVGSGTHNITSGTAFTYNSAQVILAGTGTYTLADDFTANTGTTYFYHLSGTLNTNGKNMTVFSFTSTSYPGIATNLRHIDISNSVITRHNALGGHATFLDISYLGSFTATGSHIVQTDNAVNFSIIASNTTPGNYLSAVVFNDISFTSSAGTSVFQNSLPAAASVSYNNIHFAANADIRKTSGNHPHIVDTYWVTSGRLYQFSGNYTYTITGAIEHVSTGCGDLVRIHSTTDGTRPNLLKTAAPFDVNGAIVKDINASGATMNIIGGQDAGNNLNVIVSPATGRDMYWVNGTGNWSDGTGHWSIGVSGGNPVITNPGGCIPRLIDNVFFDANSFSATAQTITIDIDAECKNMLWDANAGSDNPVFAGAATRVLNVWGTLELAMGMTAPFNGNLNMMGASAAVNAQSITTNAVSLNAQLNMNGGGRYDQSDNIDFASGISLNSGSFYSNEHSITAAHLYLDVRIPNAADISGSGIILNGRRTIPNTSTWYTYYAYHSGTGNWNATGSSIQSNQGEVYTNNNVAVVYDTIVMNTTNTSPTMGSLTTQNMTANQIEWRTATSDTRGNIITGTLIYTQSSVNNLQAGRTVLVTDSLLAYGTPCLPVIIQSATSGIQANFNSGNCNINILFGNLRDINTATCTTAENKVVGTDGGNNSNWTFTGVAAFTPLGNDTAIVCNGIPFTIDASGFGNGAPLTYLWNTGATTPSITTDVAGTYTVTVDYGASCFISDNIIISCVVPMPIEIIGFTGNLSKNCDIMINWSTGNEDHIRSFHIEASHNAIDFKEYYSTGAKGNNSHYNTVLPNNRSTYFRLKILHSNGSISYSNTRKINTDCNHGSAVQVFPNPANATIELSGLPADEDTTFNVINHLGQTVKQIKLSPATPQIDISGLSPGIYKLINSSKQVTISFIKY